MAKNSRSSYRYGGGAGEMYSDVRFYVTRPVGHDNDLVRQENSLIHQVSYEKGCLAGLQPDALDLCLHQFPHLAVQAGKWLIH